MEPSNSTAIENIRSTDRELHNQAFVTLLAATEQPVDWAYDAWDELIADLYHSDNHVRAIAARAAVIRPMVSTRPESETSHPASSGCDK